MNRRFDHEKLEVYQASLAFIVCLEPILQRLPKSSMLVGLIKANSDYRMHEGNPE